MDKRQAGRQEASIREPERGRVFQNRTEKSRTEKNGTEKRLF